MSRTSQGSTKTRNPAQHYITFNGETGTFIYWDGTKSVMLETLDLVVVDIVSSISGWSDVHNARIWSPYFKSTKDTVSIKCGNKDLMTASYNVDKEKIKAAGGKFQSNVFALADVNGEFVPVVLQLAGSSLSVWSTFVEENKLSRVYQSLVSVTRGDQEKKGRVVYYKPRFTLEPLPEELKAQADEFDKTMLRPYLDTEDAAE